MADRCLLFKTNGKYVLKQFNEVKDIINNEKIKSIMLKTNSEKYDLLNILCDMDMQSNIQKVY
jgi:hypothetical protein